MQQSNKTALYQMILQFRLYQRHQYWVEILYMIENNMIDDYRCRDIMIAQAIPTSEFIKDIGLWLWRPPESEELYAEGYPDVQLGNLIEGAEKLRFGIRILDRTRNVLILGSSGSGKTTTLRNICKGIHEHNKKHPDQFISVIIIDPKPDYLHLPESFGPEWMVFSPNHNLKIGLNGPENTPHKVWLNAITTSLAARLNLIASRTTLASMIDWFVTKLNPDPGKTLIYPSLEMILEACKNNRFLDCFSSKAAYGQTLVQALEGLIHDSNGMFDCSNGLDLQKDVIDKKKHAIFNTANLPAYVTNTLSDRVIDAQLVPRLHNQYKCDRSEVIYLLDESDLLVATSSEEKFPDKMSPLSKLERLGREMGLGACVGISSINNATTHILINSPYIIAHNHNDSASVAAARLALQLDSGCDRLLTSLQKGQCIFRQTQSMWTRAIWCECDYFAPPRDNETIDYHQHPFIPSKKISEVKGLTDAMDEYLKKFGRAKKTSQSNTSADIQKLSIDVLEQTIKMPFYPMARVFDKLRIKNTKIQANIRNYLISEDLAEIEVVSMSKTKRALILPTAAGYQRIGTNPPKGNKGRGNVVHRTFAHWVLMWAKAKGLKAGIELVLDGTNHPTDVAVEIEKGIFDVYEIVVTATDNLSSHISNCFEISDCVNTLTIVTATKTNAKKLQKQINTICGDKEYFKKIKFESIDNFMTEEFLR